MNEFNFKGTCEELKGKFIKRYPAISEADLDCSNGRKLEMQETIEKKIGKSSLELKSIISQL